jgi:hypothetical protein
MSSDGCFSASKQGKLKPKGLSVSAKVSPQKLEITGDSMAKEFKSEDERAPERKGDLGAQADELGKDNTREVGQRSAGHGAELQRLNSLEEANDESVEELADTDQGLEAASVEGVEDAADHPERPVHTHEEYGTPDDFPPRKRDNEAA